MEYFKAIIIGIVQGLTEFLPVSSSGHIIIFQQILGFDLESEGNLMLIIMLHLATALSTVVVFRRQIGLIIANAFVRGRRPEKTYARYLLISMIPAVIAGLFLKELIETLVHNLYVVASSLLATALLLLLAAALSERKSNHRNLTLKTTFVMGLSQAFAALFPGLSRSGSTIATALLLKTSKEEATQFSFLMVLPLILGASAKMLIEMVSIPLDGSFAFAYKSLLLSFIAAFLSGIAACKWMIKLVQDSKLYYFSIYCGAVSACVFIYRYMH